MNGTEREMRWQSSKKSLSSPNDKIDQSRREFLHGGLLAAAAASLTVSPMLSRWVEAASGGAHDVVDDTLNGLIAFIVPGADEYSIGQGVATTEPGGVEAGVTGVLRETLDQSAPYAPGFSTVVAGILNDLAASIGAPGSGAFVSPFARLTFGQKVSVLQIMDSTEPLKPLAGLLPAIVAFLAYSEAGVFDPASRRITDRPVGWTISGYSGVAEGRPELRGYFRRGGRKKRKTHGGRRQDHA